MVEPSLTHARSVFKRYSPKESIWDTGIRYIDPFQCKCALVEVVGVELKKADLVRHLDKLQDIYWQNCNIITEDAYLKVVSSVQAEVPVNVVEEAFACLDPTHKGFVTESDFTNAMWSVAPHLTSKRASPTSIGRSTSEIFKSADSYDIGKVTFPQFRDMAAIAIDN